MWGEAGHSPAASPAGWAAGPALPPAAMLLFGRVCWVYAL